MSKLNLHIDQLNLESGKTLTDVDIAYHTYGTLNADKSNVIWVCHALTANSDAADWWGNLIGEGKIYDPKKYFIICANILGSCYGTTGPLSINKQNDKIYFNNFPFFTVRDIVTTLDILKAHLSINTIHTIIGGSLGGFQALEWMIHSPSLFKNAVLLVTNAKQSSWGKGIHTVQRMAIEADEKWNKNTIYDDSKGLKIARAIGLLTYRHYEAFEKTQADNANTLKNFKVESYMKYQGGKLLKRFNPYSYYVLANAMDTHDIGRGRESKEKVLANIKTKTQLIGINSDLLCPIQEQEFMEAHMPNAKLDVIESIYGHDGFLIEGKKITNVLKQFYK